MSDYASLPTYEQMMLPLLQVLSENGELCTSDYASMTADKLGLSQEQREMLLPSGTQVAHRNRAGWAAWYLIQAGLLKKVKKGWVQITPEGKAFLGTSPTKVDRKVLAQFPSFVEKVIKPKQKKDKGGSSIPDPVEGETPDEQIASAYGNLSQSLATDLLAHLHKMDAFKFEQVVLDLLLAMGYGGSREEAGQITKKSNDEGIDGLIKEDRLGLDVIYIQAKRWECTVGRIVARLHSRGKPNEQADKNLRPPTDTDAELALQCTKTVLIEFGWAR
jgi:restriction system protein